MTTNKTFLALSTLLIFCLISACTSNEIGDSKDVAQNKIYQEYSISYTEGSTNAEVFCQYRFGGKNGTTLVLNTPSMVSVDGEKLVVDSNKMSGAFYSIQKPVANFLGKHSIVFTNIDDKKFENDFVFDAFKLTNVPASISKKKDLILNFETADLKNDDYIEVGSLNTDSSFSVTHTANDLSKTITIPSSNLQKQKGNTLSLQVTLNKSIPLQQNTTEGGRMNLQYRLKDVVIKLD